MPIERARPADLRRAMEAAQALMKEGILFMPMPVLSDEDKLVLANQMVARLEKLAEMAEVTP